MLLAAASVAAVLDVTRAFDEEVRKGRPTLVKFYAPWCGHCKALAPKYAELAALMEDSQFVVAEVDCTVKMDVCQAEGVRGFPTIKFYNKGKFVDQYRGQREAAAMKAWLLDQLK